MKRKGKKIRTIAQRVTALELAVEDFTVGKFRPMPKKEKKSKSEKKAE